MENPRNSASLISELFLNWVTPFVWRGYRNEVTLNDLWALNEEDSARYQTNIFLAHLENEFPPTEAATRNGGRRGSLLKALLKTFWREFTLAGICKVMTDALNILGPLLMKVILRYLGSDSPKWVGVGYAIALFLCLMMSSVLANVYLGKVCELGMHVRMVLTAAIYRKSLRLSSVARREKTVGEIVNLISNDAQTLRDGAHRAHLLWSTPALIFAATALLYADLGISVGAGMLFTFILVPISGFLASVQKKALARQKKDKDNRIRIMNEILTGIRVLKLYAWELGFKKLVDDVRAAELRKLKRIACLQAFLTMFWFFAPFAVTFVTFAAFTVLNQNQRLTPETAFTALALYQSLRVPLTKLPDMISKLIQGIVSLKRLQNFFSADELKPYVGHGASPKNVICMKDAFLSWDRREPILKNINLNVARGELLAVVGRVGDGKSSMISALLGDMNLLSGEVNLNGSVAYVSQQAWLRNATLRENILFGRPFDPQRYWDVMRRCALLEDIRILRVTTLKLARGE